MPCVAEVVNRSLKADCTDFTKICFSSLDVSEMFISRVSSMYNVIMHYLNFFFVILNQKLDFSFFESFIYNKN